MKKLLICLFVLFFVSFSFAGRQIPKNVLIAKIDNVQNMLMKVVPPEKHWAYWATLGIKDDSQLLELSVALRIHDERNRYIVRNKLSSKIGSIIALRYNQLHKVNEIWVLTPSEVLFYKNLLQNNSVN